MNGSIRAQTGRTNRRYHNLHDYNRFGFSRLAEFDDRVQWA